MLFIEWKGYNIDKNILYQGNKSEILMEVNGKRSAGKRSQALDVCYFFMIDQVEKENVLIKYYPTDEIIVPRILPVPRVIRNTAIPQLSAIVRHITSSRSCI